MKMRIYRNRFSSAPCLRNSSKVEVVMRYTLTDLEAFVRQGH